MIVKQAHSFEELTELLPKKYPDAEINLYHMIKSLSYFEDAEIEPPLMMRHSLAWEKIKDFFRQEQKRLLDQLIG